MTNKVFHLFHHPHSVAPLHALLCCVQKVSTSTQADQSTQLKLAFKSKIFNEFTGNNLAYLAKKYGLSFAMDLQNRQTQKEEIAKRQFDMFARS